MGYKLPPEVTKNFQHISKHHAFGNDFIIAQRYLRQELLVEQDKGVVIHRDITNLLTPELVRKVCDRQSGVRVGDEVGADGFILIETAVREKEANRKFDFSLINRDGSHAQISGNGLMCAIQAFVRNGNSAWDPKDPFVIRMLYKNKYIGKVPGFFSVNEAVNECDNKDDILNVIVRIGIPEINPEDKSEEIKKITKAISDIYSKLQEAHFVDVSNPHLVLLMEDLDDLQTDADVEKAGSEIMKLVVENRLGELNIEFVKKISGTDAIEMKVFERGVGVTKACGSGAVASVAALNLGKINELVDFGVGVSMEGGNCRVFVDINGFYSLGGEAHFVGSIYEGN